MIAFLTSWFRRVFGPNPSLSTPPRWATTANETDALQGYCEVEFTPNTTDFNAMEGKRIIAEQDYDFELQVVTPKPNPTPEPPKSEDKRIYDRDLNISVEGGKYVG